MSRKKLNQTFMIELLKKPKVLAAIYICIAYFLPYVTTITTHEENSRYEGYIKWSVSGYQLLTNGGSWESEWGKIKNDYYNVSINKGYYGFKDLQADEKAENYGFGHLSPGQILPKHFESTKRLGFLDKIGLFIFLSSALLIYTYYRSLKRGEDLLSPGIIKYLKYGLTIITAFLIFRYMFEIGVDFKGSGSVGIGLWTTFLVSIFMLFENKIINRFLVHKNK